MYNTCTIVDLFWENTFLRVILCLRPRCKIKSILSKTYVCLSRICRRNVILTSKSSTKKSHYTCCLIIDIIKGQIYKLISKVILYAPLQWLYNNNNIIKIKPILLLSLYIYLYSEGRGINLGSPYFDHIRVWVMLIIEDLWWL